MDKNIYIWTVGGIIIIVTLLYFTKVKIKFLGLNLFADDNNKKNETLLKGSENTVKQKIDKKTEGAHNINKSRIEGDRNTLDQNQ